MQQESAQSIILIITYLSSIYTETFMSIVLRYLNYNAIVKIIYVCVSILNLLGCVTEKGVILCFMYVQCYFMQKNTQIKCKVLIINCMLIYLLS